MTRKELTSEAINSVLKGITVPPQPQVLVDIHMEQAMPNPDIDRVAQLISQDVGLSGSILKVVNSNFFGLVNKITSIQQAVQLLGLTSVINIINGLSIKSEMDDETIVSLSRFWDTAMDIAMVSATIAKAIGFQSPDLAYTLGLFHNCGVPLLMQSHQEYPSVVEQAYQSGSERITDVENHHLNTNHAVVGFFVAKSWNLPIELCEVIAEHHNVYDIFNNPRYANYSSYKKTLLSILKMAEHIAKLHLVLGGQETNHEWLAIEGALLNYVGLDMDDFENLEESFSGMGFGASAVGFN